MANSWFQFKQFLVKQEHAAMKVTTDACLFGAWVAEKMMNTPITRALDIGTGTGLLSLMLAQKIPAPIDAVEIDEAAFYEASDNISSSVFKGLITVHHSDIKLYDEALRYDLIICNPPFFERSLRSPVSEVNLARHESGLSLEELIATARLRLSPTGSFALFLPWSRLDTANKIAQSNSLWPAFTCSVRQTEKHDAFRAMVIYSNSKETISEELVIRQEGRYSNEFSYLLRDYYLQL